MRGRPKGRVPGSWRARAETAGVPLSTFRRDGLAEAFLERCPFAKEWTRNSVYRAAEGLNRTPARYHAELIERAREISERVSDEDDLYGPHTWKGPAWNGPDDPKDERRHARVLETLREAAHEEAANVLARAWDGERLITVLVLRARWLGFDRGECLYVPGRGARGTPGNRKGNSVPTGPVSDPVGTVNPRSPWRRHDVISARVVATS